MLSSGLVISSVEMCVCHNVSAITWVEGLLYTDFAVLLFLYSRAVSLCFRSLSVLHTSKGKAVWESEGWVICCTHLIAAWPYLGCPEILFFFFSLLLCVAERSRRCRDNMMSSFQLSLFFSTIFQSNVLELKKPAEAFFIIMTNIVLYCMRTSGFSLSWEVWGMHTDKAKRSLCQSEPDTNTHAVRRTVKTCKNLLAGDMTLRMLSQWHLSSGGMY